MRKQCIRAVSRILFVLAVLAGLAAAGRGAIPAAERQALIDLYLATGGDAWYNHDNWRKPGDPTQFNDPGTENTWRGVVTDGSNSTVLCLYLYGNNLIGSIPGSMGNLTNLKILWLDLNRQLSGGLPPSFWNLMSLEELHLSYTPILGGHIPQEIGNLTNLKSLQLNSCQLSGPIPETLKNLTHLVELQLGSNPFGTFPEILCEMPGLQILVLSDTNLEGSIPPCLGQLSALKRLDLRENHLTGEIPQAIFNLTNLEQSLDLAGNSLVGAVPSKLGQLTRLRSLNLEGNQLSGPIPVEIGNLKELGDLNLAWNRFNGSIPESLGNLTKLGRVEFESNQFSGNIPASLGNLSQVYHLNFAYNQLEGSIPESLGNLPNLQYLFLNNNRLTGNLPASFGNLNKLLYLYLDGNKLSGTIPSALGNLIQLKELRLQYNRFSGTIPAEIGNLTQLDRLGLGDNQLSGIIPSSLVNLVNIFGMDISFNALHTDDPNLISFLNIKCPSWSDSQTLAPDSLHVDALQAGVVKLGWTPETEWLPGGYEVWSRTSTSEERLRAVIHGKQTTEWTGSLTAGKTNIFRVKTFSDPNVWNQNKVTSEFSSALTVNPPGGGQPVTVYVDETRHGDIYGDSPSQVPPASPVTVRIDPSAFAGASYDTPQVLWITLPPYVTLSQTLATGNPSSAAPLPLAGERVLDLAVVEYRLGTGGLPEPVEGAALASIGPHAVQLLRYVAGENAILVRVVETTTHWSPHNAGDFLGFTIGLAAGAWPATGASNWGPDGVGAQASTLLCLDLRDAGLAAGSEFQVTLYATKQPDEQFLPLTFAGSGYKLFTVDQVLTSEIPITLALGTPIVDFDTADVDGDGVDDLVAITAEESRVYWSSGVRGGGFAGIAWADLPVVPTRVDVADVDGNSRPDVLAADDAGTLHVYLWDSLFGPGKAAKPVLSALSLRLSSLVTDARVCDVTGDSRKDYLFCDSAGGRVHVLAGPTFSSDQSYAAGTEPSALTTGDFNADGAQDLAAANAGGASVSVFWNDGAGHFTTSTLANIGDRPVDLDAGDFNRDGRADLAVALTGEKAVGILLAQPGNHFNVAQEQKIFFQATPSAVLADNFDGAAGADALVGFADSSKLALCTSDAAGALQHRYSIDTLGDAAFDSSGQTVTLAADQVLSVAGGTGLGGVATRQGAAVIASLGINLIHFPRSRDLSFSVVNLGADDALVNLELYADAGGPPLATATDSIPAGSQYARYLSGVLGPAADQPGRWVRAFLTAPDTFGIWLANDPALTYLDGTRLPDARAAQSRLFFPVVRTGGGNATVLELVNPLLLPANLTLTVYGPAGAVKSSQAAILGGRGRLELNAAARFPGIADNDSIEVTAERGIVGLELFGDGDTVACLEAMEGDPTGAVLYAPHVATGNFGVTYQSVLTLVNTSETSLNVTLTLYSDSGGFVAIVARMIPARGKLEEEIAGMFGLTEPFTGYLAANPQGAPGLAGSLTFGEAGAGRFLSALPLAPQAHNRFLLGHIANGRIGTVDYFTGLALLNPDTQISNRVQITAYDQTGRVLDSRFLLLQPPDEDCPDCGVRRVFLLDGLMPGLTDIFGGYILIENQENSAGVLVFELFGDWDLNVLSAVPAVPLRD